MTMSSSEMDTAESRTETLSNDYSEVDKQDRARNSSDLPEVVVQDNYPEAYGYIRPRAGEKAEKILAYDQTGKEVQPDIVSPLSPETLYSNGQVENPFPKEPPSEEQSVVKSKHPFRGFTGWRLLILAFVVIAAGVGGGVGGGIAASRSQQASNVPATITSSSILPSSTSSSEIPSSTTLSEPSSLTSSNVSSTTSSAPTESATSSTGEGHCVGTPNGTASGNYLLHGICVSTVTCTSYGGSYISGGCPYDAEDIKCCYVSKCKGTDSFCDWTANGCNGTYLTGFCPGGSTYRCCD